MHICTSAPPHRCAAQHAALHCRGGGARRLRAAHAPPRRFTMEKTRQSQTNRIREHPNHGSTCRVPKSSQRVEIHKVPFHVRSRNWPHGGCLGETCRSGVGNAAEPGLTPTSDARDVFDAAWWTETLPDQTTPREAADHRRIWRDGCSRAWAGCSHPEMESRSFGDGRDIFTALTVRSARPDARSQARKKNVVGSFSSLGTGARSTCGSPHREGFVRNLRAAPRRPVRHAMPHTPPQAKSVVTACQVQYGKDMAGPAMLLLLTAMCLGTFNGRDGT